MVNQPSALARSGPAQDDGYKGSDVLVLSPKLGPHVPRGRECFASNLWWVQLPSVPLNVLLVAI